MKKEKLELDKKVFASFLRRAIDKKSMTQQEVADASGVDRHTIAEMVGGNSFTSIPTLIAICRVLDITPDYLLAEYVTEGEKQPEDEYHKLIQMLQGLELNEINFLHGITELMIKEIR